MFAAVKPNGEIVSTPEGEMISEYRDVIVKEIKVWRIDPKSVEIKTVKIVELTK